MDEIADALDATRHALSRMMTSTVEDVGDRPKKLQESFDTLSSLVGDLVRRGGPESLPVLTHQGVSYDLATACREVHDWISTGIYQGTELARLADVLEDGPSEPAIRRAENMVTLAAVRHVALAATSGRNSVPE